MNDYPKIGLEADDAAKIDAISGKYQSQLDRFKQAAREDGADDSGDALDKVFGKLDVKRKPEPESGDKK